MGTSWGNIAGYVLITIFGILILRVMAKRGGGDE